LNKKIYMLWGTARPYVMYETYKYWMERCANKDLIYLKIAVSNIQDKFNLEQLDIVNCEIFYTEGINYTEKICKLTTQLKANYEDILILPSDDVFPPVNWDDYLFSKFSDWDGALFLDDGYQDVNLKQGNLCLTIPCMTFSCLNKLNKIIFNSAYNHMFSDNEAFDNVTELMLLKDDRDIDNVIFEHRHYVLNKRKQDDIDKRNFSYFEIDKETYSRRKNFKIEEKLHI
jgi:hypothetical protein